MKIQTNNKSKILKHSNSSLENSNNLLKIIDQKRSANKESAKNTALLFNNTIEQAQQEDTIDICTI
jgi:hypothetical protein